MRGNAHVWFGGRAGETERPKGRHRASVRPYYVKVRETRCYTTGWDLTNARHGSSDPPTFRRCGFLCHPCHSWTRPHRSR
jgi:hypothetical protein